MMNFIGGLYMKRAARIFWFGVLLLAILASAAMAEESSPVLTLPASLQQVEDYAFLNNTAIQQVVIPEGTTQIGQHAFEGCTGLKRVSIPAAVQKIGQGAFEGCTQLVIACEPFSYAYQYAVENGLKYELEPTPQERFTVARTSGRYGKITAYSGSDTVVVIPEKIGDYIIEEIGSSVFANNSQLTGVVLPAQMATIGSSAFSGCKNLVNVAINNKLETIGSSAFYGCSGLTSVTLNDGLKTIDSKAFYGCARLTSIHIPDSVTTINSGAFQNCSKLAECNYPVGWTKATDSSFYSNAFAGTLLKTLEIPEGIKAIPANAFSGCDNFEYFDLPESLTQIQQRTFEDCTGLSEMVIPAKVETIGSYAFYGCSGLTSVTLNDGLKTIDSKAFYGCARLTSIHIPDSVTTIDDGAFLNCSKLVECNYPVGWTSTRDDVLRDGIFEGTSLKTLEIPEGIKTIPAYAFYDCDNFEYFDLPESLTQIQRYTFYGCTGLSEMVIPAKVETIGSNAFYGCSGLTSVTLNDGLKTISSYAFYGCTKLGKTYVPSSVTSIGSSAFGNCPNLKIFCEYGSTALQYAIQNSIPYYFLSLVNAWLPGGNLYQGDGYHISGQIRCSDPILSAQVRLYDAAGTVLRSGEVTNNAALINLDTYLDSCIDLPSLALGNYSIEVLATTAEETKTFIRKSFTVIPPPLRVSLSGESVPSGLYKVGADFTLAGTIRSNYSITSVTAGVYKKDGTATSLVATVVPNALTYDLANLASTAQISLLTDGQYVYQITVTSNGQTLTLKRSAFGVGTAGGDGIDDEDLAKTLKFASKWENRGVFTNLTEYEDYLFSLNELDSFTIAMVSGDKVVWKLFWDMLTNSPTNSYAVELYKARIASAVEDQINAGFSGTGDLKIYKDVVDWTAKIASGTEIGLKDYFIRLEADYGAIKDSVNLLSYDYTVSAATYAGMLQLGEVVDGLELIGSGMEYISDMGEILKQVFCDYEAGTNVLDAVQKAMGLTGNADFDEAMRQIRIEYTNSFVGVTNWLVSECRDKIGKMAIKEILSFAAGNTYKLYSLAREIIFKVSGLEKRSNNNMKFATGLTVFFNAERAYQNAFDRVYNGDQSEEALRELLICFRFTYSCADSVYATLYELSSNKAEIQDAIDNKLHAISMN